MSCLSCGNCKEDTDLYFCPAQNEFVIREKTIVRARETRWKKGDPSYESHRRRQRKEREDQKIS